jgi:hypothetical protein
MNNSSPIQALQKAQLALSNALNCLLYNSLISTHPTVALGRVGFIKTDPLLSCRSTFEDANIRVPIRLQKVIGKFISVKNYICILTQLYREWEPAVKVINRGNSVGSAKGVIPKGQAYNNWLSNGGNARKYRSVHQLRSLIQKEGSEIFLRGIVHGSIATLDDTAGFSDMDIAFVIQASVLKDPKKLLGLRALVIEVLILALAFDPFMHHGPHNITEIDLRWYPDAFFPSLLFLLGVDVLEPAKELSIKIRPSEDVTHQMIDMFEKFFKQWESRPLLLKNSFELEWFLGSAMLLPALYIQYTTKLFHNKKDTFPIAKRDFTAEEWEPIDRASYLREHLGPRVNPLLSVIAIAKIVRWPGLLAIWGRYNRVGIIRAKKVSALLGEDYPQRILHLISVMKSKIGKVTHERPCRNII